MPSMVVALGFWVLRTLIKVGMLKNRCPELFRNSMFSRHTHVGLSITYMSLDSTSINHKYSVQLS